MNTTSPEGRSALNARAVREALERYDVPVVTVPHDRHLAAAAPVSTDRLAEATMVEVTRLAGHLLARARQL
jgi:MinD-like ATPase involved in chromosome partitioning or flagellar assembly